MGARRSPLSIVTLLVLATVASAFATMPAIAQEGDDGAAQPTVAGVTFTVDVLDANGTSVRTVEPGANGTVLVTLTPVDVNGTANLTLTVATLENAFSLPENTTATFSFTNESTGEETAGFAWITSATDTAAGGFRVTLTADDTGDGGEIAIPVAVVPAAVPPTLPGPAEPDGYALPIVLGAAVAGVAVGALGGYATGKRKRPQPRPRSATLQRMELEKQAERARSDEEKHAVQEQIKEREKQSSLNRDIQILEAKRKDAERMIDLIKKRHEAGQLTKLQYEKMVEKKMAEVDKINEDIAELESERLQQ